MLQRLSRKTLTQEVLTSIKHYILSHKLRPGDNIPSERALAAELGVSSNTIRQALEPLEAVGALERRPRTGSVLKEVDLSKLSGLLQFLMIRSEHDLSDLMEARRAIELGAIGVVAQKATEEDFQRMELAISLCEAEIDAGRLTIDGDEAFHQAIMDASHNVFIQQIGGLIREFFSEYSTLQIPFTEDEYRINTEHKDILLHLKNRDAEKARFTLETHLSRQVLSQENKPASE